MSHFGVGAELCPKSKKLSVDGVETNPLKISQ